MLLLHELFIVPTGKDLKKLREVHKMTRNELAKILGVSRQVLCGIEAGYRPLSKRIMQRTFNYFYPKFLEGQKKLTIKGEYYEEVR